VLGTRLAPVVGVENRPAEWDVERAELLGRRISDLGLGIAGTRVERLVDRLYTELAERGITFRPTVYLSDQWGCPDDTPVIGVPFYLADASLERIEAEYAGSVEGDEEAMRYLRHEAGHAINYAFRLHDRSEFAELFGDYGQPYHERYAANPFSRAFVRHILGWYAQKHPDEDFAETFAVWLTPTIDWRTEYAGWEALRKLEWMDGVMREVGTLMPEVPALTEDDLPVEVMHWTVGEHYSVDDDAFPLGDARQFDGDLLRVFSRASEAPAGEPASLYLAEHEHELVTRLSYWTGEGPGVVRALMRALRDRAAALDLRVTGLEAATLIELTAFGTAVMMHWRYTRAFRSTHHEATR
jgi:Putative zinc-binding metallo-peptidase